MVRVRIACVLVLAAVLFVGLDMIRNQDQVQASPDVATVAVAADVATPPTEQPKPQRSVVVVRRAACAVAACTPVVRERKVEKTVVEWPRVVAAVTVHKTREATVTHQPVRRVLVAPLRLLRRR